jgi:hypothetical protein
MAQQSITSFSQNNNFFGFSSWSLLGAQKSWLAGTHLHARHLSIRRSHTVILGLLWGLSGSIDHRAFPDVSRNRVIALMNAWMSDDAFRES